MNEGTRCGIQASLLTRRQALRGAASAAWVIAASPMLHEQASQQSMKDVPAAEGNNKRTTIHQTIEISATPERIYTALLEAKQFAAFTGLAADIDSREGGAFSLFGGQIVGRNVELIANQRIVQAWRPTHWDPGFYSMAHFELKAAKSGTMITFDHTGFPEGDYDHLLAGWNEHYWNPLKKYLAS
jgi:activator of HSP90 ATPase